MKVVNQQHADELMHFGILGMKWGKHRSKMNSKIKSKGESKHPFIDRMVDGVKTDFQYNTIGITHPILSTKAAINNIRKDPFANMYDHQKTVIAETKRMVAEKKQAKAERKAVKKQAKAEANAKVDKLWKQHLENVKGLDPMNKEDLVKIGAHMDNYDKKYDEVINAYRKKIGKKPLR